MLISTIPNRPGRGLGRYLESLLHPRARRRSRGMGDDAFPPNLPGVVPYLPPPIPEQSTQPPIWSGVQVTAVPPDISGASTPINIGSGTVYVPPPPNTLPATPGQSVIVAGGKTVPAVAGQAVPATGYTVNAQGQVVPATPATSLSAWLAGSMIPGLTNQTLAVLGGGGMLLALVVSKRKGRR